MGTTRCAPAPGAGARYCRRVVSGGPDDEHRDMIVSLRKRIRLILSPRDEVPDLPDTAPPAPSRVEFVAYAVDCLVSGRVQMTADRLTDVLNEHDEYELVDVLVERLEDGVAMEVSQFVVTRDELLLVRANGRRGDKGRRLRTRPHPVAIKIGPYHVRGYLHAVPGADPVTVMLRRKPIVPLTDAWVEYETVFGRHRDRFATVLVNREQADWIVPARDDQVEMPDIPLATSETGLLAKDFTGLITSASGSGRS